MVPYLLKQAFGYHSDAQLLIVPQANQLGGLMWLTATCKRHIMVPFLLSIVFFESISQHRLLGEATYSILAYRVGSLNKQLILCIASVWLPNLL